jgi:hypothetical protein
VDSVEIVPDHAGFARVAAALSAESDGRQWRRDMSEAMYEALEPGAAAARSALMSRGGGDSHDGPLLRSAVAAQVHVAPLSSGAVIIAGKQGIPRGFSNAAKRFNQHGGFRRRIYGSNTWVVQVGAPGWFDDTLSRMHPQLRAAALEVLAGRARRISRKV